MCYHIIIINLPHTLPEPIHWFVFFIFCFLCFFFLSLLSAISISIQKIHSINKVIFQIKRCCCRTANDQPSLIWNELKMQRGNIPKYTVEREQDKEKERDKNWGKNHKEAGWHKPMPKCENILIKRSTPSRSYHREWKSTDNNFQTFTLLTFFSPLAPKTHCKHLCKTTIIWNSCKTKHTVFEFFKIFFFYDP